MKYRHLVVLIVVMLAVIGSVEKALADAAPPLPPPGSSIESEDPLTYVQMVSESVVMVVTDGNGSLSSEPVYLATDMMVGHVQAYFKMVNQGSETETLAVRFPLGNSDGYSQIRTVENFVAYVDGQRAETTMLEEEDRWDDLAPWASWEVTFVPGKTVNVGVAYDVRPSGYVPWGTFTYILETGAGWYGPIGEGTVVFRLPHEVSNFTVATSCEDSSALSASKTCDISGTDIKWHFSDLEPVQEDNIHFTVLAPSVWRAIQRAEKAAQTNPDSLDAQLRLAHAWREGLEFKYELVCCRNLANEALAAYEQVIRLAPNNADIHIEYLEFMLDLWTPEPQSKPEQIDTVMEKALTIAPDDPRLLEIQSRIADYQQQTNKNGTQWARMTNTPVSVESTRTPTPSPSVTAASSPTSTVFPTLMPTLPLSPSVTPMLTAQPGNDVSSPITPWAAIGAVVIGGTAVGAWVYRKRRVS